MAELRDEYGNRVELTDEMGNPVQLRDEHGNPVHIKGIATPAAAGEGGIRREEEEGPLDTTPHTLGEVLKSTNDPTTQQADVGVAPAGGLASAGAAGLVSTTLIEKTEIRGSPSTSSSSSSEDDGQGGRRKKKGLTQKIKEKLTGKHNKDQVDTAAGAHHVPATATSAASDYPTAVPHYSVAGGVERPEHEKKSVLDKIKDKLPGHGHGHHNH